MAVSVTLARMGLQMSTAMMSAPSCANRTGRVGAKSLSSPGAARGQGRSHAVSRVWPPFVCHRPVTGVIDESF